MAARKHICIDIVARWPGRSPKFRGMRKAPCTCTGPWSGADDGTRTRDPNLGKVMRYQLRYIRKTRCVGGSEARNTRKKH